MSEYWNGFWTGIAIAFFGSQLYFLYYDVLDYRNKKKDSKDAVQEQSET